MADQYGSDFITVVDDEGVEYEFEVLSTLEYSGNTYLAAVSAAEEKDPEVIIFKSTEEDEESILSVIDDEDEFEAVNALLIESLFEEEQ